MHGSLFSQLNDFPGNSDEDLLLEGPVGDPDDVLSLSPSFPLLFWNLSNLAILIGREQNDTMGRLVLPS